MNEQQKQVIQHQYKSEKEVLKELERQYQEALDEINEKIQMYQSMPETQSRIYRQQYQERMKQQVEAAIEKLHSREYETIDQYLNDAYIDGFVGTMYDLHGQDVPVILPIDQNAAIKAVMTDTKLKHKLYNELGFDMNALKKNISSELSRGISSGMAYDDVARNIKNATKVPMGRAKVIVRTEGHRIQQASAEDARQAAKSKGADVVKQWDATLDGDTRPTHRRLDGQIRETDKAFEMDGKEAMYPGDFGDAAEDCNCRCVALTRARAALDEDELKILRQRAVQHSLYMDNPHEYRSEKQPQLKNYNAFKKNYLKAAEEEAQAAASKFVPAKSKEEAQAFAKQFANTVDYRGVSLANANEINEQLAILTSKYPIKQLDVIDVGSRGVMSANYRVLHISRNKLGKTLENGYEDFLRIQQEIRDELKTIQERYAGKKLPYDMQRRVEKHESSLRFKRWGVHETYQDHVKWTVTHEYGHIVSDQYFGLINRDSANPNIKTNWSIRNVSDRWRKIYETAHKNGDVYNVSQYGATDYREFFAECFAAREIGESLPDYIEEFMDEVLRNGIL